MNPSDEPSLRFGGGSFAAPRRGWQPARVAEWLLGIVAAGCLGFVGFATLDEKAFQARETARLEAQIQDHLRGGATLADRASLRHVPAAGEPIGRLEIASAGVVGIVTPGTDDRTLRRAIGWIEGTALPGEPGNIGLAAHRDTFFRGLQHVQIGDDIALRTPGGVYRYAVDDTRIVRPDEVDILQSRTAAAALTLITCYPFDYIGSAPLRFVVHARQTTPAPHSVDP
jgi:sortase A